MTSTSPPPPAGPERPRRIGPRRGLPSGRAMLGALLVTLAVVGMFAASGAGTTGPTSTYAVAATAIEPGAVITNSDLRLEAIDLPEDVAANAYSSTDELVGAVAIGPIGRGEMVQRAVVARRRAGVDGASLEFSFPIPRSRAPRTLQPGDSVAVLATLGSGADAATVVVVDGATVIAFEPDESGAVTRSSAVLTVAIDDATDQLAAAHAAQTSDLTVVRTTAGAALELPSRHPEPAP